ITQVHLPIPFLLTGQTRNLSREMESRRDKRKCPAFHAFLCSHLDRLFSDNPKGIASVSPGLARSAPTLGVPGKMRINPNGVASCWSDGWGRVMQPFLRVVPVFVSLPRVARRLATLGWSKESLQDSNSVVPIPGVETLGYSGDVLSGGHCVEFG